MGANESARISIFVCSMLKIDLDVHTNKPITSGQTRLKVPRKSFIGGTAGMLVELKRGIMGAATDAMAGESAYFVADEKISARSNCR